MLCGLYLSRNMTHKVLVHKHLCGTVGALLSDTRQWVFGV